MKKYRGVLLTLAAIYGVCIVLTFTAVFASASGLGMRKPRTYQLTVVDGQGGGKYSAGVRVLIAARPANAGEEFGEWSFVPDGLTFDAGSMTQPNIVLFMPDEKVTATARFRRLPPPTVKIPGQ